jgi:hypothetical protein
LVFIEKKLLGDRFEIWRSGYRRDAGFAQEAVQETA